jgi:hypothetical protein
MRSIERDFLSAGWTLRRAKRREEDTALCRAETNSLNLRPDLAMIHT